MKKLLMLGLLTLLLTGCRTATEVVLLQPKETYTIELEENPSTGYSWHIYMCDLRVFEIIETRYIAPDKDIPGAPGKRRYVIKGKNAGRGVFEAIYIRSWEKDQEPAKTVRYCFEIGG